MNAKWIVTAAAAMSLGIGGCTGSHGGGDARASRDAAESGEATAAAWQESFEVNKANLRPTGNNRYLPVQPGRVIKMSNGEDTLTVTILNEMAVVDGVTVGILEERETKDGKLEEISRNFLATDKTTGDVYYLGEDVDNYKDGKIVSHDSAWRSGMAGARFGMMMPARPRAGQKFYQELAPKVAMDRIEIVGTDETVKTRVGVFEHCVHFKETTPIESEVSHKYFAPGIGMIKDDDFELAEMP